MKIIDIFKKERELERLSIDDLFKEFHKDKRLHKLYPDSPREKLGDLNKFKSNYKSFLLMLDKDYLNVLLENHGIRAFNEMKLNDSPYLFEIEKRPEGGIDEITKNIPPNVPKKESYLLKINKSIGIFGFEENETNLPNIAYAIYNGEIINHGSIDFIKPIKPKFKINENGKILEGNFERDEHKNILELPPKYDPNQVKLPFKDFFSYTKNKVRDYVEAIVYRNSFLLFSD